MEWWWFVGMGMVLMFAIYNVARQAGSISRDVARLDRKLNLLLQQMNISFDEHGGMSDRVKDLARDPSRKIEAIKAYREETGAGLAEAKQAVEAFIESLQR
jgi:Ribosomal protein L7/L12 C-terminal domain